MNIEEVERQRTGDAMWRVARDRRLWYGVPARKWLPPAPGVRQEGGPPNGYRRVVSFAPFVYGRS